MEYPSWCRPMNIKAMGSLWVEEPVHTSWSRFCTVNHWALAGNYQLSNMKVPGPRFEPATSEVEGEHSNHYTTEPPMNIKGGHCI